MPGTDSPPPFAIRFRARTPPSLEARLYQRALELTAVVHAMIEQHASARIHLRERLDRHATFVALSCGRALAEVVPSERRRLYRAARPRVIECGTILDILDRQARVTPGQAGDRALLEQAQALIADLAAKLAHLERR